MKGCVHFRECHGARNRSVQLIKPVHAKNQSLPQVFTDAGERHKSDTLPHLTLSLTNNATYTTSARGTSVFTLSRVSPLTLSPRGHSYIPEAPLCTPTCHNPVSSGSSCHSQFSLVSASLPLLSLSSILFSPFLWALSIPSHLVLPNPCLFR